MTTHFHKDTSELVMRAINELLANRDNVRIFTGNTDTGVAWAEEYDVFGRIGRSTGSQKVPLLVAPRANGGPALLDHCIIGILGRDSNKRLFWYYKHPRLSFGEWTLKIKIDSPRPFVAMVNGKEHAAFETSKQCKRYIDFMTARRLVK